MLYIFFFSLSSDNSGDRLDRVDRTSLHSNVSDMSGRLPVYDNRVYHHDSDDDIIDTRLQVAKQPQTQPTNQDVPLNNMRPIESNLVPSRYYDNLASIPDMDSDDGDSSSGPERPKSAGPGAKTPPTELRPYSLRQTSYPPATSYEPRPFGYAANRPYSYTSAYNRPNSGGTGGNMDGGGISGSFV